MMLGKPTQKTLNWNEPLTALLRALHHLSTRGANRFLDSFKETSVAKKAPTALSLGNPMGTEFLVADLT